MTGHSSGSGYPTWRRWVSKTASAASRRMMTTRGSSPIRTDMLPPRCGWEAAPLMNGSSEECVPTVTTGRHNGRGTGGRGGVYHRVAYAQHPIDKTKKNPPKGVLRYGLLLLGLVLSGCAGGHTVSGEFVLRDDGVDHSRTSCEGTGGYSDIGDGTQVTVSDETGKVIASSRLSVDPDGSSEARCAYTFDVRVPDSAFYVFEVSRRGGLTYSKVEMESMDWHVGFTLGE